jgi:Guanylyl transferase CofC like
VQRDSVAGARREVGNHAATQARATSTAGAAFVIAVRRLEAAKTRLSPTFTTASRAALVQAMLADAIAAARTVGAVESITADSAVAAPTGGRTKPVEELLAIAEGIGRPARERTTANERPHPGGPKTEETTQRKREG